MCKFIIVDFVLVDFLFIHKDLSAMCEDLELFGENPLNWRDIADK